MTPEEKVTAANLADVEPITAEEWRALPEHKREVRSVFVRLPDPAPVVALRTILRMCVDSISDDSRSEDVLSAIYGQARTALAEFDGTTS